ncbi:MAG: hypothetical protein PSV16_00445 [Flavobacterium sp.]|nr:hypothetical protein [Flavobacterium sp.]
MWENFVKFIHDISDWLEAIGFITAIITVVKVFLLDNQVRRLKEKHLFQVRIEEHLDDLKKSSKNISNNLDDFPRKTKDLRREISQCLQHCLSLSKKVESGQLQNLKPVIKRAKRIQRAAYKEKSRFWMISIFQRAPIIEVDIEEIYMLLNSLITETEHFNKDLKKSIK